MKLSITLALAALVFSGCYVRSKKFWSREEAKIERCRGEWRFHDLAEEQELKVLLFRDRFLFDIQVFPAFAIGINHHADTIAVIDKDFEGVVKIGEKINISPSAWTAREKENIYPVYSVYPKARTNDLHCAVKGVFYVKIQKKEPSK